MRNLSETTRNVLESARLIIDNLYSAEDGELYSYQTEIQKLEELIIYLKVQQQYSSFHDSGAEEITESTKVESEEVIHVENLADVEMEEIPAGEMENLEADFIPEEQVLSEQVSEEDSVSDLPEFYEKDFVTSDSPEIVEEIPVNPELMIAEEELDAQQEMLQENIPDIQVSQNEKEKSQLEEIQRGKIVEFEHQDQPFESQKDEYKFKNQEEKKFKLANIKGLKKIQSLFDEDPLENAAQLQVEAQGELHRRNVPTDYLEAKVNPEFKLDLNDRIAFTKILFDGSQTDLNNTVKDLNSFSNVEQAKEYLSDLYYARNWKKADEYAQRLWNLVESRFV